tara:strand:+ start:45430 stop:45687 length:258 start_codon:yes stop_codon:yes gene_type:complete
MTGEHHNLKTEFPEYEAIIHELKMSNAHFQKLSEKHHTVDKEVRQAEIGAEAVTDEHLEDLKKSRLKLRDELYQMMKKEAQKQSQ